MIKKLMVAAIVSLFLSAAYANPGGTGTTKLGGGGTYTSGDYGKDLTDRRYFYCSQVVNNSGGLNCYPTQFTVEVLRGTPVAGGRIYNFGVTQYPTAASNGSVAGYTPDSATAGARWFWWNTRPSLGVVMVTDTSVANTRYWFTMSACTGTAGQADMYGTPVLNPASGAQPNPLTTNTFVGVGYESGVNGGRWTCCSAGTLASTYSCVDVGGAAVANNTMYKINVDYSTAGSLVCTVNGTSVTKTTLLPTGATEWVGKNLTVTTIDPANVSKLMYLSRFWMSSQ